MKIIILFFTLIFSSLVAVNLLAQEMPLVYNVENTGADCPIPYLPSFSELPSIEALPDPFEWSDGRGRISNFSDWRYRRAEIKAEIEHYEIGEKPDRPDSITASYANDTLTVIVTINGNMLTLTSPIILPSGDGPFPAVIGMNSPNGSIPASIFSDRNIARITFSHNQVTTYGNPQNTDPYYRLYPNLNINNTGQYSAWIWGVSRIIDGLELVQNDLPIDLKHLAVTGCSYAGKMALFAGAFDERIALTIAQESGGGGYTTWRYSQELDKVTPAPGVETLGKTDYNWFRESLREFANNNVSKLPYDHHELIAMVAPRALLVTGNPDYIWLADESGHVGSKAAQEVYKALGISDRFGFSIVDGHSHCSVPDSQVREIEAFVEKFLLGNESVSTEVSTTLFNTNLSPWVTWSTPTLSNDTSYLRKTSLISPENLTSDLDSSVTFVWNRVEDAEKYFIQLSTDPAFKIIAFIDSTTDTVKTISSLSEGKRYYWRVQVKNINGSSGPWSNQFNFTTFITLPGIPQLISANLDRQERADFVKFSWLKLKDAAQYLIQLSKNENFTPIFKSALTSDTTHILNGTIEGQNYFWRVQASNVAGTGPWSDLLYFNIILPPTDLNLESNAPNQITLIWDDNSNVEEGYIVERKEGMQSSFSVIDTLEEDLEEFIDKIEQAETYTYRVKAYKDSATSEYSNEASLTLVGVEEEDQIPSEYSLSQNYPNPFNPATKIKFALPKAAYTKIIVYNLLGREIQTLINKELHAGYHEINIDAEDFSSGIYFYRIHSGDFVHTKKMIVMK